MPMRSAQLCCGVVVEPALRFGSSDELRSWCMWCPQKVMRCMGRQCGSYEQMCIGVRGTPLTRGGCSCDADAGCDGGLQAMIPMQPVRAGVQAVTVSSWLLVDGHSSCRPFPHGERP